MSHHIEEEIDLTLLQLVAPQPIVDSLVNRLNYGLPFTYLGETSLVVVNPNQDLGLFTQELSNFYVQNGYKALEPSPQRLQPHIYEIGTKAYFVMRRLGTDQSLIFSGASDSGKSVSYRESLRQLGQLSLNPKKPSKIPEQLDHILDIVQSFTHCSTSSNSTSSRLGLYQECQFTNRGRLAGIKTIPYYFDKFRLANIPQNESNFHILYHLIEVATPEERSAYGLNTNFNYLPVSIYYRQNSYLNIQESLKQANFKAKSRAKINQILAAILHLGNLEFVSAGDGQEIYISNVDTLDLIADLLGLDSNELFNILTSKTQLIGKELCTTLLDVQGASYERHSIATTLYSLLFTWLIESINSKFCNDKDTENVISLLEEISFETESTNSYDKFCRNFINERVRAFTLDHLLSNDKSFRLELSTDGLQLPDHLVTSFRSSVSLLVGEDYQSGMVNAINRYSRKYSTNAAGDSKLLSSLNKKFSIHEDYLQTNPASQSFTISHFGNKVEYELNQFISSNVDNVNLEFIQLFQEDNSGNYRCNNQFLIDMMANEAVESEIKLCSGLVENSSELQITRSPSKRGKGKLEVQSKQDPLTRIARINNTLNELLSSIELTRIWPIFHINPFSGYKNQRIDFNSITNQVKNLNLDSLANNLALDLGIQFEFNEFLQRYEPLTSSVGLDTSRDLKSQIDAFAIISGLVAGSDYVLGNSKVFLSFPKWKELEDSLRVAIRDVKSPEIDQSYIGFPKTYDIESLHSGYDNIRDLNSRSRFSSRGSQLDQPIELSHTISKPIDSYTTVGDMDQNYTEEALVKPPLVQMEKSLNNSELETVGETKEGKKKSKKEKKEKKVETKPLTFARKNWVRLTWFLTWWIPSCCLSRCGKMKRPDVRMAWREKVAICLLIFFSWCIILFMNIGLGLIFCPPIPSFKFSELSLAKGKSATAYMYGGAYDLVKLAKYSHGRGKLPEGVNEDQLESLEGNDITSLFPLPLRAYCPNLEISDRDFLNFAVDINYVERFDYSNIPFAKHNTDPIQGATISDDPYWYFEQTKSTLKSFRSGRIVYGQEVLQRYRDDRVSWGVIDGKVYDLSVYVNMTQHQPKPNWMPTEVVDLFKFGSSYDIKNGEMTKYWNELKLDAETKNSVKVCLDNVFYVGEVDPSETIKCRVTDILLLVFSGIALSVTAVKFLAALQLSGKRDPQDYDKFVILQVPCYTEGEESVRRTLESLATLQYKDQNKLIFVIADGMIIGGGNDLPTPRIVLNVLGVDPKLEPESFAFKSLGEGSKQLNYGKVYSGLYEIDGHSVPYIVVVKVGSEKEVNRPGNRGKRDSQIILMQFLNRVHFDTAMTPLELEMYHQMKNVIGIDPKLYEFILMVDADTEVLPDSLNRLVAVMARDSSVMGLCGETTLVNENQSITTMMQVYEYYISHHLAKAFESLFGSVTCLPGCFSMYRVKSVRNNPLIVSNKILEFYSENEVDTLHKKNLLSLGEDRYLTTLMLQQFPNYKMKFTPDATCRTVVPEKFEILLSQRRRWINSTIHNLFELLWLKDMCGFCCFSMRFVVMLDLVGTLILPASVIYLVYIIIAWSTKFQIINLYSILIMASIYILQGLLFIIKQKWEHIGWMIFYLFAIPLYNFYIPIYSYWHFDDFSWGNTRVVVGDGKKQVISEEAEPFDPESVPLMTWAEHEQNQWDIQNGMSRAQTVLDYNPGYEAVAELGYPVPVGLSPSRVASPSPYATYGANNSMSLAMKEPPRSNTPQFMQPGMRTSTYDSGYTLQEAPRSNTPQFTQPGMRTSTYESGYALQEAPRPSTPQFMQRSMRTSTYSSAYSIPEPSRMVAAPIQPPNAVYRPMTPLAQPQQYYSGSPATTQPQNQQIYSPTPAQFEISEEVLAQEIQFILSTSDLSTITKKTVRARLQETFQADLSSKKEFINRTIDMILD